MTKEDRAEMRMAAVAVAGAFPNVTIRPEHLIVLLDRVDELEAALEWYADENNYDPHKWDQGVTGADRDEGERARIVLGNGGGT